LGPQPEKMLFIASESLMPEPEVNKRLNYNQELEDLVTSSKTHSKD
jgi:hypothetical protein